MCPFHRLARIVVIAWEWCTLIECHDDVRAQFPLNLHDRCRSERVAGAVDVGLELHALGTNAAQAGKAEYLEAAAVGEHGPIPTGEPMQSARGRNSVFSGPKVKVVRIAEDN